MGPLTMSLKKKTDKIYAKFDAQNKLRDELLAEMRKILKNTREAISAIHRNEFKKAVNSIESAKAILTKAQPRIQKLSQLPIAGLIHEAEGEVTEAVLLLAFCENHTLPGPKEIGVSDISYLLGLGDLVGELRRVAIDALKEENLGLATRAFNQMEEVYAILLTFDFPRGLTPGVRKKTDVARGLVERTRADISTAIQNRRLLAGVADLEKTLKDQKGT